ncbi:MAG: type IV secretion system DNA-binding domain-containing protein [Campylobacterota bacterium]|nr:type IV secretion system DNA-binding domain-containing protein [Campylobacterota bacterium]
MENFDIGKLVEAYSQNATIMMYTAIPVLLIVLYLLRNPIKSIISSLMSYRAGNIDDYSFSIHKNRDVIFENEKNIINEGLSLKNAILLTISIVSVLIHPLLFVILYATVKTQIVKLRSKKIKDYSIYKNLDDDDEFLSFLNNKSASANLIIDELFLSAYLFITLGLFVGNMIVSLIGLSIIVILLIVNIVMLYNIAMYRINYKQIEFYRALRLLETSTLNDNKSLLILMIASIASNFTVLAGLSAYIWSTFILRLIIRFVTNSLLKKEDGLNENHLKLENRDYTNLSRISSYPNFKSKSRGYKFSTLLEMKFFELEKKDKKTIHLDNYAFYPDAINRTDLRKNPLMKNELKDKVKVMIETLDFTKQILILGSMGSGKTALIKNLIKQVIESKFTLFDNIVYNDIKGDFTNDFYREDKDIIVNLYDSRAKVWCPFLEMESNIEAGTSFISNLFESAMDGQNGDDFFSGRAKQLTSEWLKESYFETDNNIEAWEMFFAKISDYEEELKAEDDKTKSSILQTILISLEILKLMHFQIVNEKRETFTFEEFVNSRGKQLFFVNNKQYEVKLTPYLTGLTAAYINTLMSKDDYSLLEESERIFTLNVFDEFLTMKIDDPTRKTLLTAIRSKGGCNILPAQYLINDEKLIQDLDSSRYAMITFNINDDFTMEKVLKKLGRVEHLSISSSEESKQAGSGVKMGDDSKVDEAILLSSANEAFSGLGKKKQNNSYSIAESQVVTEQQLQSLPKYHHLTFIPSEETKNFNDLDTNRFFKLMVFGYDKIMENIAKSDDFLAKDSGILYLGYTPNVEFSYKSGSFKKWDIEKYYKSISKKQKKSKKMDEKTEFIHYMNIKFAENTENAKDYILKNNLETLDIETMFKNVEENSKKVHDLLLEKSESERYELMEKFFEIDENDMESKYKFCKKHNLIGAILGIFTFSDEFRNKMLKEVNKDD